MTQLMHHRHQELERIDGPAQYGYVSQHERKSKSQSTQDQRCVARCDSLVRLEHISLTALKFSVRELYRRVASNSSQRTPKPVAALDMIAEDLLQFCLAAMV
jgi:hypothetical protein